MNQSKIPKHIAELGKERGKNEKNKGEIHNLDLEESYLKPG